MAGIEKTCEFSGEYGYWDMYRWKRNQLQIMPQYRKLFRGAKHELTIEFELYKWKYRNLRGSFVYDNEGYNDGNYPKNIYIREKGRFGWEGWEYVVNNPEDHRYVKENFEKLKLTIEWKYTLRVFDEHLQGEVEGVYVGYTHNISTMKRKLKRLLKCRELNIVRG